MISLLSSALPATGCMNEYTKPEKTILSLNAIELEPRFNGSWVAFMPNARKFASLWQLHSSPLDLMHSPKYPTRTVNVVFPARFEKVELSV